MHDQPHGWTPVQDAKVMARILMFAAESLATTVEVFLHTRFGVLYFGPAAVAGLAAIPAWILFWPGHDPSGLIVLWLGYVLMAARARAESARLAARGDLEHSRYAGRPRLSRLFPHAREQKLKEVHEPLLVIGVGLALLEFNAPLATYLVAAGVGLAAAATTRAAIQRARVRELNDAWIEQRQAVEAFRELQRGRR